MCVEHVRATPSVPTTGRLKAVPAHFDIVLVREADANENQHTRGTYLEGLRVAQLRVIFALPEGPEHLRHSRLPTRLAYIDWFTPFRAPHPDSGLFPVSRTSRNNAPISEIIPLDSILSSCHIIPRFGTKYLPAKWDSDSVLEQCKSFFLNKYLNIRFFFELERHQRI